MTASTEELRAAASKIRAAIARVERLTPYQSELGVAIAECQTMGFSRAPLAIAVATWLEDHARTLDLLGIEPDESIAVARFINQAEVGS